MLMHIIYFITEFGVTKQWCMLSTLIYSLELPIGA